MGVYNNARKWHIQHDVCQELHIQYINKVTNVVHISISDTTNKISAAILANHA
jgi:hypothetical protein